jgi:hypothetical protein
LRTSLYKPKVAQNKSKYDRKKQEKVDHGLRRNIARLDD